jgi:acyl-CoA thioesterase-1
MNTLGRTVRLGGAALVVLAVAGFVSSAQALPGGRSCHVASGFGQIRNHLEQSRARLDLGQRLTVVAIGSSSTAGAGASSAAASYPNRLAAWLERGIPGIDLRVLNRGANGEEAGDMLERFDRDVLASKPDLVLWQVGTNAVIRGASVETIMSVVQTGLHRLKQAGTDVILVDPQYVPKVIFRPTVQAMVGGLETEARAETVGVFHRYELMRHWRETEHLPFEKFVSADGLHMNDWGYDCFARNLARTIIEAAVTPAFEAKAMVAQLHGGGPAAVGLRRD